MEYIFETEVFLKRPQSEVFEFFSDAKNLEVITPPWLQFKILSVSTQKIQEGTVLEYSIKIKGVPVRWKTLIEKWNPNESFVDTQLRGPYTLWHHTHRFVEKDGGTLMIDRVRYKVPLGFLGAFFVGAMVRRDVNSIFSYRREVVLKLFS